MSDRAKRGKKIRDEAFGKDGATIVAQENVKARLASGSRNGLTGNLVPPAPEIALPKQTYKDTMTVRLQGRAARGGVRQHLRQLQQLRSVRAA